MCYSICWGVYRVHRVHCCKSPPVVPKRAFFGGHGGHCGVEWTRLCVSERGHELRPQLFGKTELLKNFSYFVCIRFFYIFATRFVSLGVGVMPARFFYFLRLFLK